MNPLRCGYCGRFIAYSDFESGKAVTQIDPPYMVEDDEEIWYYHVACKKKEERHG